MKKISLLTGAAYASLLAPAAADDAARNPHQHDDDEIIVTGSPITHPEHESIIGATVLAEDELAERAAGSIGELLRREPGVSSTFFGPAASRPVIRGLGGNRVSVLDAGIGSIDASATSDDHAVAVEPATAERVEMIRGAAILFYGSSAAGGVVNIFDGRMPDEVPDGGVDGGLRWSYGAVDDSIEAAGGGDIHLGKIGAVDLVVHGDGFYRNTDDYEVPGFAKSARLRAVEEAEGGPVDSGSFGVVENSDLGTKGGSLGASLVFDNGFFGVSGKALRANYAVPAGPAADEAGVRIDLEQDRIDLMGELNGDFLIFQTAKLRVGYADYIHQELEADGAVGTTFLNEGVEGRIELLEKDFGNFRGADGIQIKYRDFAATGEEAFTPPSETTQIGFFTVREYEAERWHLELGGRYEHTDYDEKLTGQSLSFDGFSVSGGIGIEPTENTFFGVNIVRTERAPAPEELFSDGPHLATGAFEVGDITLDKEIARGVEGTLHGDFGAITATVNAFYTDYKNFIALVPTGAIEDDLPIFQFVGRDATFKGFEAQLGADLFSVGAFDVAGNAQGDFVRAKFTNGGDIPRIPPLRGLIGLKASSSHLDLKGEVELAAEQDEIAAFELATDGYAIVNLAATFRPGGKKEGLSFQLRADNVTDEEARLSTSFLKDTTPLPGRNIRVMVRGSF